MENRPRGRLSDCIPSTWSPPEQSWRSDPEIIASIKELETLCVPRTPHSHTDKEINKAIKGLRDNLEIHILKADKGRSTVIWSTRDYDAEALRQLSDSSTYRELTKDTCKAELSRLSDDCAFHAHLLEQMGCITKNELQTMIVFPTGFGSAFYLLPKVHKGPNCYGCFVGRPIVATFTNPVHYLDKFLTQLTAPLLHRIPGSLRDTPHLLELLKEAFPGQVSAKTVLVTADVTSLYTNVPWKDGIDAAAAVYIQNFDFLKQHAIDNGLLPPPPVSTFVDLLYFVLSNSYIHFKNEKFYKQTIGTAMGMCISVFFANAYMYSITKEKIENMGNKILFFQRYIDDLIVVFADTTEEEVAEFFRSISNENIKYTVDPIGCSQNFLDVTVSINPTTLQFETRPFWKPTSSGSFLHPNSNHPEHVIKAIPYSQFLRIRGISSTVEIFQTAAIRLRREFIRSGYPKHLVEVAYTRALRTASTKEDNPNRSTSNTHTSALNPQRLIIPYRKSVDYVQCSRLLKSTYELIIDHYVNKKHPKSIPRQLMRKSTAIVNCNNQSIASNFTRIIKQGTTTVAKGVSINSF